MALTKLPKNAIADGAIDDSKIEDGTIQNQEIQGSLINEKFAGSIANDRLANSSITVAGSTVSLGASLTIATDTDWQALTVADGSTQVITEAGKGYFLDTNAGVIEIFLPSSPTRGDTVVLADYSGTFGTNQLIINTGGVNIDSTVGSEFKVTTNNAIVECVYVDAAKGWLVYLNQAAGTTPSGIGTPGGAYDATHITATGGTITTSGDFKIHTFTGDGCFSVAYAGAGTCASPSNVDYLVVAGGGGGAQNGAGGGAGGYRESKCNTGPYTASPLATPTGITLTAQTYPITVGAGGASGPTGGGEPGTVGGNGSNSIFSTITSTGGGAGYQPGGCGSASTYTGGSGGGGNPDNSSGTAGAGNTPPTSPSQGNPGGNGATSPGGYRRYGGGGGASTAGGAASTSTGGVGGTGTSTNITGSSVSYSGGGGGGTVQIPTGTPGAGSPCGTGGGTTPAPSGAAGSGTINRGGGGGGGSGDFSNNGPGGAGGKGIVIIRYKFQ